MYQHCIELLISYAKNHCLPSPMQHVLAGAKCLNYSHVQKQSIIMITCAKYIHAMVACAVLITSSADPSKPKKAHIGL